MEINRCDIYLVGVGGQGVLTIGELISQAALKKNIPANFFPTKGMAQRGGFVKAEIRLGRETVGPSIPLQGADLVIAMERSESLKAIRYLKPQGEFFLYGSVWAPTAVMLGKGPYPSLEQVREEIEKAGGTGYYLDPQTLPEYRGNPVAENLFVLGWAMRATKFANLFTPEDMIEVITKRWPKGAEGNLYAFRAGLSASPGGRGALPPQVARQEPSPLASFFCPRGVAVTGSATPGKLGYVLINRLVEGGFPHIYAVNPRARGVGQVKGYASVGEIPDPVDLVVIASPAATVPDVLKDCGEAGVKGAVIITSGFSEAGNKEGEEEIKKIARTYGIHFIGPNCSGLVNTHSKLLATLEAQPPKGNTALISQSGAVGGMIMAWAEEQGLGISKFVSYGNRADLNEIGLMGYLKDDPETKVVALYLENITQGREFMQALKELTGRKPVVVIKSGRTGTGRRAALSHTGSMAGADAVYDAALKECGALRVENMEEMLDLCKGFSLLPDVAGRRLAIVTNSGGPGVMAADKAEEAGLLVAEPGAGLKEELEKFLPPHAGLKNPIDLTVEGTGEEYRRALISALGEYDAALALYIGTPYLEAMPVARGMGEAAAAVGKPLAAVLQVGNDVQESSRFLRESQLPNFATGERAVKVFSRMAEYAEYRSRKSIDLELPGEKGSLPGQGPILEPDALDLLEENGIPVPGHCFAASRAEAIEASRSLGYPVVMKVVSPEILHKSDCGGVVLNIDNDEAAGKAYCDIRQAAGNRGFSGVVVYPMLKGGREVILGLTRDAQFGPVVAFGLGGIYTEILKDIVLRVAPVNRAEADEMIRSIRAYPMLRGVRGTEPADLDALAETIVRFSQLPFLYPDLGEADLNPVFVFPRGVLVGDVRLVRG